MELDDDLRERLDSLDGALRCPNCEESYMGAVPMFDEGELNLEQLELVCPECSYTEDGMERL